MNTTEHDRTDLESVESTEAVASSDFDSSESAEIADPTEPVTFADLGLSDAVLSAVADMGYENPTPVQAAAIPEALAGRDVLAAAQTGTGKTAAFLLPTMDRLGHVPHTRGRRRAEAQGPLMLVVTPTRELAQQIEKVCRAVARRTRHTSVTVVGGLSYNPQKDALRRGCDVLIATPGRLQDLIDQGACSLDQVQVLVLDEADRMLDMGFLPAVRRIVGYMPADRQTLLFSATLDEKAVGSITDLVHDPARVEIAPVTSTADTVEQYVLPVALDAKNDLLQQVLRREGTERAIVFTRTKHRAETCCRRLARAGISCAAIHGDRTQAQRQRALKAFRNGQCDVLVATDVLARGIDISDVRYVINFDVPEDPVDYIHRIGRTGRAGEAGWSLTFVTSEDLFEFFDIEALMGKTVDEFDAEGLDLGEAVPEIDPERVPASKPADKREKKRRRVRAARAARSRQRNGEDRAPRTARGEEGAAKPSRRKRGGKTRVHAEDAVESGDVREERFERADRDGGRDRFDREDRGGRGGRGEKRDRFERDERAGRGSRGGRDRFEDDGRAGREDRDGYRGRSGRAGRDGGSRRDRFTDDRFDNERGDRRGNRGGRRDFEDGRSRRDRREGDFDRGGRGARDRFEDGGRWDRDDRGGRDGRWDREDRGGRGDRRDYEDRGGRRDRNDRFDGNRGNGRSQGRSRRFDNDRFDGGRDSRGGQRAGHGNGRGGNRGNGREAWRNYDEPNERRGRGGRSGRGGSQDRLRGPRSGRGRSGGSYDSSRRPGDRGGRW